MQEYEKTQWRNKSAPDLDQTNMNHIEQGIYECNRAITSLEQQYVAVQESLSALNQKITDLAGTINSLISVTADLQRQIDELKGE